MSISSQTLAAPRSVDAIGGRKEFEVFDDLHVIVDAEEVGHVADQAADLFGMRIDGIATDVGFAPAGAEQRGDDSHRGRLARAVGADESEQIPSVQLQFDRLNGNKVAVLLGQISRFDHDLGLSRQRYGNQESIVRPILARGNRLSVQQHVGSRSATLSPEHGLLRRHVIAPVDQSVDNDVGAACRPCLLPR